MAQRIKVFTTNPWWEGKSISSEPSSADSNAGVISDSLPRMHALIS